MGAVVAVKLNLNANLALNVRVALALNVNAIANLDVNHAQNVDHVADVDHVLKENANVIVIVTEFILLREKKRVFLEIASPLNSKFLNTISFG